ncbi:hypothetical protein WAK64_06495 [Bacillus spongiae]|uniref:Uncharacterized protein n=1 Tax=Bacillus spongiae TaxID=2683610 RepID=A0ABU8HBV9_9BACI
MVICMGRYFSFPYIPMEMVKFNHSIGHELALIEDSLFDQQEHLVTSLN